MFNAAIDELKAKGEAFNPVTDADYMKDGVLYCGHCHTPKRKSVHLLGSERMMPIACKCAKERYEELERQDAERERRKRAEELRWECFGDKQNLKEWNFSRYDGKDDRLHSAAKSYADNFETMLQKGQGLLFYGPTGRSKSFHMACIANAIMDKCHSCYMTDFESLEKQSRGFGQENPLKNIARYKLLCLDDFGAERDTSYMQGIVFSVIDTRCQANLPMIITTNLTLEDLKKPKNITEERIFKRVLERCFPVEATGPDRRILRVREDYHGMKEMLGL